MRPRRVILLMLNQFHREGKGLHNRLHGMKGMIVTVFEVTKTYIMKGWIQNGKIREKIKYRNLLVGVPVSKLIPEPVI